MLFPDGMEATVEAFKREKSGIFDFSERPKNTGLGFSGHSFVRDDDKQFSVGLQSRRPKTAMDSSNCGLVGVWMRIKCGSFCLDGGSLGQTAIDTHFPRENEWGRVYLPRADTAVRWSVRGKYSAVSFATRLLSVCVDIGPRSSLLYSHLEHDKHGGFRLHITLKPRLRPRSIDRRPDNWQVGSRLSGLECGGQIGCPER